MDSCAALQQKLLGPERTSPAGVKPRVEKRREKRLQRKEKRKALLAEVVKTIPFRPKDVDGVSSNWESFKDVMGIKESNVKPTEVHKDDTKSFTGPTKAVALDCEMVGVGPDGRESALARVTIVNSHENVIYDKYVKPREPVVDYRTRVSGIRPEDLLEGVDLAVVQKEVSDLLQDRILVGHGLRHDFKAMFLSHPNIMTRDTSLFRPFREMFGGHTPSLKNLVLRVLQLNIQDGEHSSAQDAQMAMRLYLRYRNRWENEIKKRSNRARRKMERRNEKAAIRSQQAAERRSQLNQMKTLSDNQPRTEGEDDDDDDDDDSENSDDE